jgi:predicted Zn-dependent protease with MMP-like domain
VFGSGIVSLFPDWRRDRRSARRPQDRRPQSCAHRADGPRPPAAEESHPAPKNTREAFERRVAEALATIPRRFRDAMSNIAIGVEDEPSDELLHDMEIEPPDTLFGLYQGTPLTERGWAFGNALPDRILLFQGPHEREAEDEDDLIVSIGETLIHEIGHYFGMSEEEIEEIEEKYWHRRVR